MPELAEVERMRREWDPGVGSRIREVYLHPEKRIFRGIRPDDLAAALTGSTLRSSESHGKQMMFFFSATRPGRSCYLGVHLGMTGELRALSPKYPPERHDHLVLRQAKHSLVLTDPRLFGRVTFAEGSPPEFWTARPPAVLDRAFTLRRLEDYLRRHRGAPIKALLLDQAMFPGIGNWMADEILWRAELHPRRTGLDLDEAEVRRLWKETRFVAREALLRIAERGVDPPATWLFPHRWEDGGRCPRTGTGLVRETIGGRTTCWSPGRQPELG
ncbi:MAG: DNA-formamidopyrimidine glycosylase family protein [Candidatus Eisenbacteria bacterium]